MINELTNEQWNKVDLEVKKYVEAVAENIDIKKYEDNEIHNNFDGYEQREYLGNYFTIEAEISDTIKGVLGDEGMEMEDLEYVDVRMIEGFYDLMYKVGDLLSDELPSEWYCYFEDSDVWMARSWDSLEDIPEDLQELVNE